MGKLPDIKDRALATLPKQLTRTHNLRVTTEKFARDFKMEEAFAAIIAILKDAEAKIVAEIARRSSP